MTTLLSGNRELLLFVPGLAYQVSAGGGWG
ncbi:hypothetical protein QFZ40_002175 [Arthrobacter pascens]|nr:hypothetical protein [Arthrobacter pascens]